MTGQPRILLAALLLVAVGAAPLAAADHPEPIEGNESTPIVFDHRGGNEWWVEVRVTAYAVDAVYARTESGTWKALTLRSWGNWAGSFHIPPGERVQFQAMQAGGMTDVYRENSCFFTHPGGQEQCDGAPQEFRATFRDLSGSRYWQQVYVDSNMPLARVSMHVYDVTDGSTYELKKRDWGAWATSQDVREGSLVQFFASDGATSVWSECYRWPDAVVKDCLGDGGPGGPTGWHTRFDHKGGNEWWVEVDIGPLEPTRVLAQDDGGSWRELTLRDWGNWAGSFRIEAGHDVRFRALVDGTWFESCWFSHPTGLSEGERMQLCGATAVEG